jgi:hypothetical protein
MDFAVGHGEFGIARFDCIGKDWTCKKKLREKWNLGFLRISKAQSGG